MTSAREPVYLDSSGLVKLVEQEAESEALEQFLACFPWRVSCALARVEVGRAARRAGPRAEARVAALLGTLDLVPLDDPLLDRAVAIEPIGLRSLDAVHLAAAVALVPRPVWLITYDRRMIDAAPNLGLIAASPA